MSTPSSTMLRAWDPPGRQLPGIRREALLRVRLPKSTESRAKQHPTAEQRARAPSSKLTTYFGMTRQQSQFQSSAQMQCSTISNRPTPSGAALMRSSNEPSTVALSAASAMLATRSRSTVSSEGVRTGGSTNRKLCCRINSNDDDHRAQDWPAGTRFVLVLWTTSRP